MLSYVGGHYCSIYSLFITKQHDGKRGQICLDIGSTTSKSIL